MLHTKEYYEQMPHDTRNPSHWHALFLDKSIPFNPDAKAAFLYDSSTKSRQFLYPVVKAFARISIVLMQVFKIFIPNLINAPKMLHKSLFWGMKYFITPEANFLILRHFYLGSEVLRFIKDNVRGAENIPMNPLKPTAVSHVRDNLFLEHDLNLYNFIINLNKAIDEKGVKVSKQEKPDFSAISATPIPFEQFRHRWTNFIDLGTAIEIFTPVYQFYLTDADFWRATNSLQLDEVIGIYAATIMDCPEKLTALNNKHPMIPLPMAGAAFRLLLHGFSTEVLHALLVQAKLEQQRQAALVDVE
ncbi:hypothetical protein SAMN05428949_2367 [Chitinophaga sp. YR627]|uniref:DUF6999 family protein n=1 Tax=Chitinophaga sp. YR627 TaxID=1881041 RepID=UPI0008E5586B|nr:hypothetical protein [Chitinophaga sp. YR627]SFN31096.1 hypothetical protein SAMN05428949_2367 [Chitinophaga sp. YR627]